jgi:class 3 adenylate cyclase/tetratricopeptide (TPR) repeat protein
MESMASHEVGPQPAPPIQIFLIADVRGYTRFTLEHGDEAAARLATRFAALTRTTVEARGGRVLVLRGDEALAVFSSARQAVRAALEAQARYTAETLVDPALPLPVGIGLDVGEAVPVDDSFRGAALNLAARLCSLAGPGEVLVSEGVVHLTGKMAGLVYVERGLVQLKGFSLPVRVTQVLTDIRDKVAALEAREAAGVLAPPLPIGGFLGALPSGPLVARESEMSQALAAADAVMHGSGRLVLLTGEPGIGKTRLAQEVTLAVRNRGFLVATGRCYEPEQTIAYYPFLEALAIAAEAAPASLRDALPRRWPDVLRLIPERGPDAAGPPAPERVAAGGQEEQQRLFWAITGFVRALAEYRPVAFLFDDLHWADSASLALLQHLARHTRAACVLLLGTYRDVEITRQHPLEGALRSLSREQLLERIAVRRLTLEGTAALMAASFGVGEAPPELASLLHQRTDGNPFFTQEVLHALVARGDVFEQDGHWQRRALEDIAVPESVRSAIGERAARLSQPTQEILCEASVLGQSFTFADLLSMSGRAEADLETALEEAVAAGLLRETTGDTYAFNHALTQQSLYAEVPARRRRRLHRLAGEMLERLPERDRERRVAELSWHFLEADATERALPYILRSGDAAEAVFAHGEAERHYATTLDLARELGDQEHTALALERLGAIQCILAHYDAALGSLDAALNTYQQLGDDEGTGRVTALLGQVHSDRGTPAEGIARIQPLLAGLDTSAISPRVLAALHDALAQLFHMSGQYTEQLAASARAADLARAAGDARLLAQVQMRQGNALRMLGRMEEARAGLEDVIRLAEASGDIRQLTYALENVSVVYLLRGELATATRYVERALRLAEQLGDPLGIELMTLRRGMNAFATGDWERARADFERAVDATRQMDVSWVTMYASLGWGMLCLARGDGNAGERYLAEAVALGARSGDLQALRWAQSALAEHDILSGRPASAHDRLEPLLDRPGQQEGMVTYLLPYLVWAYLDLDDLPRAQAIHAECVARTVSEQIRLAHVEALRVGALLARHEGDPEEAIRRCEEAVSLARSITYPYAEAKALYTSGELFSQRGNVARAREKLLAAQAICARLGERAYAARIERALSLLPGA